MIVSRAQNMLLHMLILSHVLVVSHPCGNGESGGETVVEHGHRNRDGGGRSVKLEHLVGLVALVRDKRSGPFGSQTRIGEQIDRWRRGAAEFALRLDAVGVAVAAFPDMSWNRKTYVISTQKSVFTYNYIYVYKHISCRYYALRSVCKLLSWSSSLVLLPCCQVDSSPKLAHVARNVAQFEACGREQLLLAGHWGVVDAFRQVRPAQPANPVHFYRHHHRQTLTHS